MQAGAMDLDQSVGLKGAGSRKSESLVVRTSDKGVTFRSYRDGSLVTLTPETSVAAQKQLGADIIIPFDHLLPFNATQRELEASVNLSHRWEEQSLKFHLQDRRNQAMYSVIHGGMDFNLRKESVQFLTGLEFDGHAVGGSLGKSRDDLIQILKHVLPSLPEDKPNHILGIGDMESIQRGIPLGADTFDSSYPTRAARHGTILQTMGSPTLAIRRRAFAEDQRPLMEGCDCPTCTQYTRAYLHHLYKAKEQSGSFLCSVHNLYRMNKNMAILRQKILNGEI